MLVVIEQVGVTRVDPLDTAASPQTPLIPISAPSCAGTAPERQVPFGQVADGARESAGLSALPDFAIYEKLSSVQPKLKDFATGTDISAIARLIVRLNRECFKAAREGKWAALGADIAAQDAAAKALRDSGLCQLFGSILTSGGTMAGGAISLKGASQAQARFDELFKIKIQRTPPRCELEPEVLNDRAGQLRRLEAAEGELQLLQNASGKAQGIAEWDGNTQLQDGKIESPPREGGWSSGEGNAPNASLEADARPPEGMDSLQFTRVAQAQTAAQQENMKWNGMNAITTETFKLVAAGATLGATHYQEEQIKQNADSTRSKAQVDDEKQFSDYYQAVFHDVMGKLAEIRSAESETRSRIINMA
ncbi:hypothetical protein [Bradyrhizobium sp. CB3481]|uniref:hypothetical protein n=1 Tax=Bradyrhizobium sp. CB3481 TaxID=3039158 RepID=UPI0024B16EC5|nr:hypothetical protein [Bradyrhizobium sp. CB3481]WFU14898.1 hypothetical protein QA643_28335 [Bradyrhizobium sp. CB3481]